MTSEQVTEWQAYNKLEPIGEERVDWHFAQLSALIANLAIDIHGKPGTKEHRSPLDFMPDWGGEKEEQAAKEPPKQQSVEDMKKILYAIAGIKKPKE